MASSVTSGAATAAPGRGAVNVHFSRNGATSGSSGRGATRYRSYNAIPAIAARTIAAPMRAIRFARRPAFMPVTLDPTGGTDEICTLTHMATWLITAYPLT